MDIDFNKLGGLVPAVVQDAHTKNVLMVGFMNQEALNKTLETKKVTFWSRTRQKLWTKGEQSGHFLDLVKMEVDCDRDTLLVHAIPNGPVCHTGSATCFSNDNSYGVGFLSFLQDFINRRRDEKVGEEALETALEAANGTPGRMIYEASDMLYHLIVLLASKGLRIEDVVADLESRHGKTKSQYNKHQE